MTVEKKREKGKKNLDTNIQHRFTEQQHYADNQCIANQ